jgi:hypothetical protein
MFALLFGWLKRRWDANKYLILPPCERCGGSGAGLVIDAIPAGKRVDGKTGLVTKTFTVKSADWLCPECRRVKKTQTACGASAS